MAGITAFYNIKTDASSHMPTDFLLNGHIRDCLNLFGKLLMAVDAKLTVICFLIHPLTDQTDQPDDSEYMVHMLVGYKDIMDVTDINAGIFQHF